jgi:hypothetical protein
MTTWTWTLNESSKARQYITTNSVGSRRLFVNAPAMIVKRPNSAMTPQPRVPSLQA